MNETTAADVDAADDATRGRDAAAADAADPDAVVVGEGVRKSYGDVVALDGVDIRGRVRRGVRTHRPKRRGEDDAGPRADGDDRGRGRPAGVRCPAARGRPAADRAAPAVVRPAGAAHGDRTGRLLRRASTTRRATPSPSCGTWGWPTTRTCGTRRSRGAEAPDLRRHRHRQRPRPPLP